MKSIFTAVIVILLASLTHAADLPPRTIDFCQGWRFFREDVAPTAVISDPTQPAEKFDDSAWERVSRTIFIKASAIHR